MREESTIDATEPQTESPESSEGAPDIEAARQLLVSQGLHVLDSKNFSGLKQKAAREATEAKEALSAEYEALKTEAQQLADFKRKVEDKDKSETQIWQDRQREWQKADSASKAKLEEIQKALDAKDAELSDYRLTVELNRLIGENALNREMALMWAKAKMPGLAVDKEGTLVFVEPTGVEHEGKAAEKIFSDWWANQKDFHRPNAPGPVTKGAPSAPTRQETPETFVRDPNMSAAEWMKAAEEFDRRKNKR